MPLRRRARATAIGLIMAMMVAAASVDYTVRRGDTLSRIAAEHGVSVADLAAANGITNPDRIYAGQVLLIPGEAGQEPVIHVVARGEVLSRIAGGYGVKTSALVEANKLTNPNVIFPGQKLIIPVPGGAAADAGTASTLPPAGGEETSNTPFTRSGASHIVQRGETLDSIAAKHGVTAEAIATANGILKGVIYSGTRLFLDGPGPVAQGGSGTSTYTVKTGDRLADIAASHGTSVSKLATLNGISNVNLIRSGQVLEVPGSVGWVCPVAGATFFNDWGFPRSGGRYHEGNDLFAPTGTEVRAPVSGTVMQKVGSMGGNQVNLEGSDGILYIGSHLDSFGKSGQVSAGDVIGYVGTSGNARGTRAHLHFGMYLDGLAINPYPSLVAAGCK